MYNNGTSSIMSVFTPTSNINLLDPSGRYEINLYDVGIDQDDFMGGIIWTPNIKGKKFPSTERVDAGFQVAFDLSYQYVF